MEVGFGAAGLLSFFFRVGVAASLFLYVSVISAWGKRGRRQCNGCGRRAGCWRVVIFARSTRFRFPGPLYRGGGHVVYRGDSWGSWGHAARRVSGMVRARVGAQVNNRGDPQGCDGEVGATAGSGNYRRHRSRDINEIQKSGSRYATSVTIRRVCRVKGQLVVHQTETYSRELSCQQ